MAISLELVNYDKIFRQLKQTPMIINDIVETSETDKDALKESIFTKYDSDLMKSLPSCDCGDVIGEFNVGVVCENCHTPVVSTTDKELEPIIWMRSPNGVEKLINPMVWTMLCSRFNKADFNVIKYLTDTSFRFKNNVPDIVTDIHELEIERGYNYFVKNFFTIINKLLTLRKYKNKTGDEPLLRVFEEYKDCLFSKYIPLPNRALLVIEETNVGIYIDPIIVGAIDAIQTIASIDSPMMNYTVKVKENRVVKTISGLSEFFDEYFKNSLGSKYGTFRQHVVGSRSHFAFRAVVSSLTDKHDYDEVHIPWSIGIAIFRYHILNKLLRMNYSVNSALELINVYSKQYNPLIDSIFEQLIADSPRKGIEVTMNRNPSLARGSIQFVRITKVKKDPAVPTISFSIKVVTPLSADFDGRHLPSLNSFNCWKLLLSTFTTTQSEKTIVMV